MRQVKVALSANQNRVMFVRPTNWLTDTRYVRLGAKVTPLMDEKEFLLLLRDKVDLLIPKISINQPLIEISAMITERLNDLQAATVLAKK